MSVNQFYSFLFVFSLFGGLSFVLLVEVCKLRKFAAGLLEISNSHRREISRLQKSEAIRAWQSAKIEDLQAITSIHTHAVGRLATQSVNADERLKRIESVPFVVVRMASEAAGKPVEALEPGEVHPFAPDAFVTVEAEAA